MLGARTLIVNKDRNSALGQLLRHSSTNNTDTNNRHRRRLGHHFSSHEGGRVNSRQPPRSGGVPPRPRSRSQAAKRQARESAAMARLSIFTVGLTRIELVTSSLSGMRSNRLSYSPRRVTAVSEPYRRDRPALNR